MRIGRVLPRAHGLGEGLAVVGERQLARRAQAFGFGRARHQHDLRTRGHGLDAAAVHQRQRIALAAGVPQAAYRRWQVLGQGIGRCHGRSSDLVGLPILTRRAFPQPAHPPRRGQQQCQRQRTEQHPQSVLADRGDCSRDPLKNRGIGPLGRLGFVARLPAHHLAFGADRRVRIGTLDRAAQAAVIGQRRAEHLRQRGRTRRFACRLFPLHDRFGVLCPSGTCDTQQRDGEQQWRCRLAQARAQPAQHDLDVPAFDLGATVEVQPEAGADEERFDQRRRQPGHGIAGELQPYRLLCQRTPRPACRFGQVLARNEQHRQCQDAEIQHDLEVHAHRGQQHADPVDRRAQRAAPVARVLALSAFEQVHRQV